MTSFHIDLTVVDNQLIEEHIKPWIDKQIIEYFGESESILVEFICSKILKGASPQEILDEFKVVLEEEAEMFVMQISRFLVYEVEVKRLGLVKIEEIDYHNDQS